MMSLVKFGAKIMTVVAVMTDRFQAVGISLQNSCLMQDVMTVTTLLPMTLVREKVILRML